MAFTSLMVKSWVTISWTIDLAIPVSDSAFLVTVDNRTHCIHILFRFWWRGHPDRRSSSTPSPPSLKAFCAIGTLVQMITHLFHKRFSPFSKFLMHIYPISIAYCCSKLTCIFLNMSHLIRVSQKTVSWLCVLIYTWHPTPSYLGQLLPSQSPSRA